MKKHILAAPAVLRAAEKPAERPNVVLIYVDDLDFNELGVTGGKALTPHMDSIAKQGMRFDRAYCTSPVCTPSRYSLLTGQ